MLDMNSTTVLVILGLLAVQVAVAVASVVYVVKTPQERIRQLPIVKENSKIFWIVLAIVGNFSGALLTLIFARTPVPLYERDAMRAEEMKKAEAVAVLYGEKNTEDGTVDTKDKK